MWGTQQQFVTINQTFRQRSIKGFPGLMWKSLLIDPESPSDFTQSVTLGLTGLSGVLGISEPGILLEWECSKYQS